MTAWKTFVEVCRLGSFSSAAVELGFTQSAVSRQIATLERNVGAQLLSRGPRGVELTPAGEAFRLHARVVVNEIERAGHAARHTASTVGESLAIGAVPSLLANVLPSAIGDVDTKSLGRWTLVPGLTFDLETRVVAGELDLAFVTDAPPGVSTDQRVQREPIGADEMCVIVPIGHPLAGAERQSLQAFARERWVDDNAGSATLLRNHAARAGFEADIDMLAFDLLGKMGMVAAGHGVALIPATFGPSLRADISAIPLRDSPRRGIFAITAVKSRPRAPAIEHLVAAVQTVLADLHRKD